MVRIDQGGAAMSRVVAIVISVALTLPSVAVAQNPQHGKPAGRPVVQPRIVQPRIVQPRIVQPRVVQPRVVQPRVQRGGPPQIVRGGPPGGAQFTYRGRMSNRVRLAPFVYPRGFGYRRWAIGAVLPAVFLVPAYYYADWADLGLAPPDPGFQWVRYGPDLVLVNTDTGEVVDMVYGVFAES
jgi:Ni/Co efflux regulator RcnB